MSETTTDPRQMLLDDCDSLLAMIEQNADFPKRSATRIGKILSWGILSHVNAEERQLGLAVASAMGFAEGDPRVAMEAASLMALAHNTSGPRRIGFSEKIERHKAHLRASDRVQRLHGLRAWLADEQLPALNSATSAARQGHVATLQIQVTPPTVRRRTRPTAPPPPLTPLERRDTQRAAAVPTYGGSPDPVLLERANMVHEETVEVLRRHLEDSGIQSLESPLVDLACRLRDSMAIMEVKSLTEANEREQVRAAFAQLHDYRYTYQDTVPFAGLDTSLWVVLSSAPHDRWTLGFLASNGVRLLWLERGRLSGPDLGFLQAQIPPLPSIRQRRRPLAR